MKNNLTTTPPINDLSVKLEQGYSLPPAGRAREGGVKLGKQGSESETSRQTKLPTAFIFDWDNTLVESWGAIADAINHTRQHFGQAAWTLDEVRVNCTHAAKDIFPDWFGDRSQEALDVFFARFRDVHMKNLAPLQGAENLLLWIKSQKIPAFIVSNKTGEYLRREAEALQWQHFFQAVTGAQDAPKNKPSHEHVDYALDHAQLKADASIWFIGDTAVDVECARNSGCTPVLIGDAALAKKLDVELAFDDCQALQIKLHSYCVNE